MPHVRLLPHQSASIAIAAANALNDPPPYDIATARVPQPGLIHNIYPDRTFAALSLDDPRWTMHPPTGVLPPVLLQELKASFGSRAPAPARVAAFAQGKAPQPSAPPLQDIGSRAEHPAPQKTAGVEKTAKRLQKPEQWTLELLKKKRKLEAQLQKLEGDLHQARANRRR